MTTKRMTTADQIKSLEEAVRQLTLERDLYKRIVMEGGAIAPSPPAIEEQRHTPKTKAILAALKTMSPRMHFAIQSICAGKTDAEIAEAMNVTVNGAKTYVHQMYMKMGLAEFKGNKRSWVSGTLGPIIESMSDDDYVRLAGLPKNLAKEWKKIGKRWQHVFDRSARPDLLKED